MASDRGKQQAYCKVCSKHFSVSHGGIDDVRRHGEGKNHIELFNARKSTNPVTKYYVSSNSNSLDENVIKAETLISLAIAKHNVPLAFADHLAKVVKEAFPDSSIAKKYACGRGKTTQIIKRAIDPIQWAKVVEMCQNNKFSLMIDESNDHNCDKGLVILVRAAETTRVHTRFLDMPVVNVGSGENIFNAIDIVFRKHSIPWTNVLGFTSDNCNAMMGKGSKSVLARIKQVQPDILEVGCICHLANLCVGAAVKALPVKVDDMLVSIYYHFQKSSKRKEEFKEYEHFTDTEPLKILKHAATRWLSLERCVKRTIAQWPALESYFKSHPESDKPGQVKQLAEQFESTQVRLYFMFLSFILGPINEFNTAFQTDECSIGLLIPEINRLLRKFMAKFVKMAVIKGLADDLTKVPYQDEENQHSNEFLAIGTSARLYLAENKENLTVQEENSFFNSVRGFYVRIVDKMIEKFPFGNQVLGHLSILNPYTEMNPHSVRELGHRYNLLSSDDLDDLVDEAQDYYLTPKSELPTLEEGGRIDEYWLKVFKMQTGSGKLRFSLLGDVMKPLLSIPNSNADSERVFSMLRKIHTEFRSELDNDTICSLLSSKINVDGCCYNAAVTKDHFKAAKKATWSYVQDHPSASSSSLVSN